MAAADGLMGPQADGLDDPRQLFIELGRHDVVGLAGRVLGREIEKGERRAYISKGTIRGSSGVLLSVPNSIADT